MFKSLIITLFFVFLSQLSLALQDASSTSEVQVAICNFDWTELPTGLRDQFQAKGHAIMQFYESNNFDFYKNGIQVRKKTNIEKNKTQIVTKVRFNDAKDVSSSLVSKYNLECEYDTYATKSVYTCKMKEKFHQLSKTTYELLNETNRLQPNIEINELESLKYFEFEAKQSLLAAIGLDNMTLDNIQKNGFDYIEISSRARTSEQNQTLQKILSWAQKQQLTTCTTQSDRFSRLYNIK